MFLFVKFKTIGSDAHCKAVFTADWINFAKTLNPWLHEHNSGNYILTAMIYSWSIFSDRVRVFCMKPRGIIRLRECSRRDMFMLYNNNLKGDYLPNEVNLRFKMWDIVFLLKYIESKAREHLCSLLAIYIYRQHMGELWSWLIGWNHSLIPSNNWSVIRVLVVCNIARENENLNNVLCCILYIEYN